MCKNTLSRKASLLEVFHPRLLHSPFYQQGSGRCEDRTEGKLSEIKPGQVHAKIQHAIGPHEDLLPIVKRRKLHWYGHVSRSSGLAKTNHLARHSERGEEDKADRGRGGKTTSGNGQAWSSPSPRGQWRTGKNGGNWLQNHLWCPSDPRG